MEMEGPPKKTTLKIDLPYGPTTVLENVLSRTLSQHASDTCTSVFTAALITWPHPRIRLSVRKQMNRHKMH